jgi:hypothetical protein
MFHRVGSGEIKWICRQCISWKSMLPQTCCLLAAYSGLADRQRKSGECANQRTARGSSAAYCQVITISKQSVMRSDGDLPPPLRQSAAALNMELLCLPVMVEQRPGTMPCGLG